MCAASSSFPVPDSPESSTRDVGSRHLRRLVNGVLERRASADHPRAVADQLAKTLVLALQLGTLDRVLDDEEHAVARERLLQEVERAATGRLDRIADRSVPGDHHGGVASSACFNEPSRSIPLPSGRRTSSR